ncbi:hypothetical protein [Croceibacterium ferulae]|uniref:hypothetical protein n=1 Tax=Croceibacterium ferulae TaxID=1854641 RepID=UPI000F88204D|nr:hypothetical protein [Croceibacterium ferulae]
MDECAAKGVSATRRAMIAGGLACAVAAPAARAQFRLGDLVRGVTESIGIDGLIGGGQPITTSLGDAQWGAPELDGVTPTVPASPMTALERTATGGFMLQPGYYSYSAQSYCLHAGTHGPGEGDGYLYAPLAGSAEIVVRVILRNSVARPEIEQSTVQSLIWAILSRAKLEDLNNGLRLAAAALLSPRQLATLNRSALDLLPGNSFSRLLGQVPAPLRAVVEAEAELRQAFASGGGDFAQLESIAVLAGAAPLGPGSQVIPSGRWSEHPDGFRVRYIPSGYSQTLVEVWVEDGAAGVGREFDPSVQVAVPGNTARQRLAQSGRERVS